MSRSMPQKKSVTKKPSTVLVINVDSSRAEAAGKQLKELAASENLQVMQAKGTELSDTLRQVMKQPGIKRLIIAGGDGSVALASQCVIDSKKRIELAVIPIGTANYFSKSLGLAHKRLATNFSTALHGRVEERYVCMANNRVFLLAADLGMTSQMFNEVTKNEKQRFGKFAYVRGVIKVFFRLRPFMVSIKANNRVVTYATTEIVVLNQHLPERVKLTPDVHSRDPYFEVVTYGLGDSKIAPFIALLLFVITLGRNQRYLTRIRATSATITTQHKQPVSLDGDPLTTTPLQIRLYEKPLRFVKSNSKIQ
jgi:diacylglycerol kinase (ATP)